MMAKEQVVEYTALANEVLERRVGCFDGRASLVSLAPKLVAASGAGSYPGPMKTSATRGTRKRSRAIASPRWDEEDDRALEKLLENGVDRDTIIKTLGRSQADVVWRIAELRSGRG